MSGSRTIHGVTWTDDLAWMDAMRGRAWKDTIQTAQERWTAKTKPLHEISRILASEIEAASHVGNLSLFQARVKGDSMVVSISVLGVHSICWNWDTEEKIHNAASLDVCEQKPGFVWVVEEAPNSEGAEIYQLSCYVKESTKPVWTVRSKDSFAPYVTVLNNRVYCIESTNRLVYNTLVSFDALTGDNKRVHYSEEPNTSYNLSLQRCSCDGAYFLRSTGPKQDAFWIDGTSHTVHVLEGISLESRRFVFSDVPKGYCIWTGREGWKASRPLQPLRISVHEHPEYIYGKRKILVTKSKGVRTIYRNQKPVWKGLATVTVDPWDGPWIRIEQPGMDAVWWNTERDAKPICAVPLTHSIETIDLEPVPLCCVIVRATERVKGLLVIGYGAYGMPTRLSTNRWQPLLHRGWAICIGLWRGGGDDSPLWEDAGRLGGREDVLRDAEAVVRAAQKVTGCGPESTWLYGRSAGGLWVGGLVASRGRAVCSGAYMEVPYLDVLQTTTNTKLPLTFLETDEFGLPMQRLSDFTGMMRWSPMELLRADSTKAKEVQQIVRTGLHDKEVYAYESVKWVERCGRQCLLAVEDGQGHFVHGRTGLEQQGMDLAVLLDLASA